MRTVIIIKIIVWKDGTIVANDKSGDATAENDVERGVIAKTAATSSAEITYTRAMVAARGNALRGILHSDAFRRRHVSHI